jgi:exopolyphosphatase/guanosine-5'-triphosphate,3'-diphosphate pyrophosphatase
VTPDSTASTPFPLRVGAADVGTNAIRFVAAEFVDATHWIELESQRVPVRLGHNTFLTGNLEPETMAAAVEALSWFRRTVDSFGLPRYRAVATSAVRESRNGGELVDRVRGECGIHLDTITGSEEARLVWLAVRSRIDLGDRRWMLADLGGGSLEVCLVSGKGVHWIESHTMGTVRLLEDLGGLDVEPDHFRTLVSEYAGTLRMPGREGDEPPAGLIATGGNIEALALLTGCEPDNRGVSRLSLESLREWIGLLSAMTAPQRVERFGLREDRADVILPAALIYERVAVLCGVNELLVPHVGVRDGVLLDLVEDVIGPSVRATRMEQHAFHGALALGRRYNFDEGHARHVTRLALSLFDQLQDLHELDEADRRILLGAAVLHDVGQFVSYRRHHKHSLYIVYHSELPSFSRAEISLVALVARYHRRAEPKPEHFLFVDLAEVDRGRVRKLAAILRVADALDREHLQRVQTVTAVREGGSLVLEVEGRGDLLLEHWALRKKARMFESVFGVSARLLQPDPTLGPGVI